VPSGCGVTGLAVHETVVIEGHIPPIVGFMTRETFSGIVISGGGVTGLAIGEAMVVK